MDCAYYGNYSNKDGAVRHLGDDEFGMGDKSGVDESINIYPGGATSIDSLIHSLTPQ